jgi:fructuronate reductase
VRLSTATTANLPPSVAQPGYDRSTQKAGCVHFGIGAFHRAHQAVYNDDAMNGGERDWGIIGVSLRSPDVAEQMNPQDGLYTLAVRTGEQTRYRLIGSVQKVLVASQDPDSVIEAIASPDTNILTFTITEKGYCRASDGSLDPALAHEGSVYHFLRAGISARRAQGLGGLTLLSCDNLAANGAQLRRLVSDYFTLHDPDLLVWVSANCTFPSSMVDRIVPATTKADRDTANQALGLADEALVGTEPFSQWIIEDDFAGPRPAWEKVGATIVSDVAPYEMAKLRMLNGAHSALAYIGLCAGHAFVHEAVADPKIRPIIEQLIRVEAAATIKIGPGQDLDAYATALLARFDNKALHHRLSQIAMDGSQKIPQRWLETLAWHRQKSLACPAIEAGLAAWFQHLKGANGPVDDPRAAQLATLDLTDDLDQNITTIFGRQPPN